MPMVPGAFEGPQVLPFGRQQQQASGADFGAQVGQAEQGLGQAFQQGGQVLSQIAIQQQQVQNEADVNTAYTKLSDGLRGIQFGQDGTGGFYSTQGAAAGQALPGAAKAITSLQGGLRQSLSNPMAQRMFDDIARRRVTMDQDRMAGHVQQQNEVYQAQAQAGMLNTLKTDATLHSNDSAAFAGGLQDVERQVRSYGVAHGESEPMIQMQIRQHQSEMWQDRILTTAINDPHAAVAMIQQAGPQLMPDTRTQLLEHVTPKIKSLAAQSLVDGIYAMPGSALGPAAPLIDAEARAQGVDPTQAQTVAQIESRGGAAADARGATHTGVFQLGSNEFAAAGGGDPNRTGDQVRNGVSWIKQITPVANAAVGGQAVPWQTYLVHQQGVAGGTALLKADPGMNVVDALLPAYNGNRALATQAISANAGDPGGTVGQFTGLWARKYQAAENSVRSGQASGGGLPAYPDVHGLELKVIAAAGGDPDLQQQGLSVLHERLALANVQAAQARDELSHTLEGTSAALQAGDASVEIPETLINAAMPQPEAARTIANLHVDRQAGQLLKGLRWATPQQQSTLLADLSTPDGGASRTLRMAAQPGVPDENALGPETPDQYLNRQRIFVRAQHLVTDRNAALKADPALFVSQEPTVQAASQMYTSNPNPDTLGAYVRASTSVQRTLGVPEQNIHIFSNDAVAGLTRKIVTQDPAEGDTGVQLDAMARQYGQHWPQVFNELVEQGHLPNEYQMLAVMDAPGQTVGRQDFQRMLQFKAQKGGLEAMMSTIPDTDKATLRTALDGVMGDFQATTQNNSGGFRLYTNVRDSVSQLAAYRMATGAQTNATTAVQDAYNDVVGLKYDFRSGSTMRVPKFYDGKPLGWMVAQSATAGAQAAIKGDDLKQIGNDVPGMTEQDSQDAYLRSVKSYGKWVPNRDDSGLVLMRPVRNSSALQPVYRRDGSPFELKFKDMKIADPTVGSDTLETPQ